MDGDGADVDALRAMPEVGGVLLTPSHQFPLGVSLHSDRRAAVIDWARRTGGVIIEDDYDGEFRYDRSPVGALHGGDPDHVIYMGTASKSLAPGLRLGWLAVPDRLVDAVARQKGETEETSGFVDQLAMAEFIVSGSYDRHIRTMRAEYRRRREQLVAAVARASPTTTVTGMPAGLHVMLELAGGDASALARSARVATTRRRGPRPVSPSRDPPRTRRFGDRVRIACAKRVVGGLGRLDRTAAVTVRGLNWPLLAASKWPTKAEICAISVESMLAAGNTKITDLLCVTPPPIPEGAHAMTQLVELPPADAGLGPHRHSGPVFGYMLAGRILFELEGESPA